MENIFKQKHKKLQQNNHRHL